MQKQSTFIVAIFMLMILFIGINYTNANAGDLQQQPTTTTPTVTGTPLGPVVTVQSTTGFAYVRSGPSTDFEELGLLYNGEIVPALGQSAEGFWIKVEYYGSPTGDGWIYSPLVINNQTLPILEPVGTPTPRVTPTIDPVLAAQFIYDQPGTRLPTYTAPAPLAIATYTVETSGGIFSNFPMGLVIVSLFVVGLFGTLVIYSRR
jgi:uncharacterized protein YraI